MPSPSINIPPSRKREEIIAELRSLICSKGYLYALCLIIFEDFHIIPEKLHETNYWDRLSHNEAAFILGFLIQNELDFTHPETPEILAFLKRRTYELMKELHDTFNIRFFERLKAQLEAGIGGQERKAAEKDFFGKGDMLVEPIFYSGTGAYDFQYIEFLDEKYKYDREWLIANKGYDGKIIKAIVSRIKTLLNKKAKQVNLVGMRERWSAPLKLNRFEG